MRVRELTAGQRGTFTMLLKGVREVKKDGREPYCILSLAPSKAEPAVEAKLWDASRDGVLSRVSEMQVVTLGITAKEWNGGLSYIADSLRPADGDVSIDDFIECSPVPGEKMFEFILKNLSGYGEDPSAVVATELCYQHREQLIYWPAAVSVHHAYRGGLLQHMGTVALDCKRICCCASGSHISDIRKMDARACYDKIYQFLKNNGGESDVVNLSLWMIRVAQQKGTVTKDDGAAQKRLIAMMLASKLCGSYPFLNKGVLFSAIALRGISGGTGTVGQRGADYLFFLTLAKEEHMKKEAFRLLAHCLLVGNDGGRKAAIPEAYFADAVESLVPLVEEAAAAEGLNEAALVSAASIHDIGKIRELSSNNFGVAEFGLDGSLFGHAAIGLGMAVDAAGKLGISLVSISTMIHCVASHHGKIEWDALIVPESIEARILAAVDYMDSHLEMYRYAAGHLAEGERDESMRRYLGNAVYRPAV